MSLERSYDVIVSGGGIAGICAAIKASSLGASVLLVERYPFVGGMATAGMVSPFMKHSLAGVSLVRGVFESIQEEMRHRHGMIDNGFYAAAFRLAAFHLLEKSGVTSLLKAEIHRVVRRGDWLEGISVWVDGQEFVFTAPIFVDATGDAQLLYLGEYPWACGDERTGNLQALTTFFTLGGIDLKKATDYVKSRKDDFLPWMDFAFEDSKIVSVAGYFSHLQEAKREKRMEEEVPYIFYTTLPSYGEASFNTTNILSLGGCSSGDLTRAEWVGRRQIHAVVKLLQEEIPGFENAWLMESAVQVGVRETRRAIGDYVVTEEDIARCHKFPDAIARGCYGIDIHPQPGEENRLDEIPQGEYYEVPMRSLVVKEAENVLVAGRCISASRKALSALRIMPTCAATGEACGAFAYLASRGGIAVRTVEYKRIKELIAYNLSAGERHGNK